MRDAPGKKYSLNPGAYMCVRHTYCQFFLGAQSGGNPRGAFVYGGPMRAPSLIVSLTKIPHDRRGNDDSCQLCEQWQKADGVKEVSFHSQPCPRAWP